MPEGTRRFFDLLQRGFYTQHYIPLIDAEKLNPEGPLMIVLSVKAAHADQSGEHMSAQRSGTNKSKQPFWKRHSLSLTASGFLALWFVLYLRSDPKTHAGSFSGIAIADWLGVVITILATKYFFAPASPAAVLAGDFGTLARNCRTSGPHLATRTTSRPGRSGRCTSIPPSGGCRFWTRRTAARQRP
jgi:hypothetical protein